MQFPFWLAFFLRHRYTHGPLLPLTQAIFLEFFPGQNCIVLFAAKAVSPAASLHAPVACFPDPDWGLLCQARHLQLQYL